MNASQRKEFVAVVWAHYARAGRHDLPWRRPEADGTFDAYKILVSELMLQQTQVSRVLAKFGPFIEQFPSFTVLATAPLAAVLRSWSGLGYNRRAKFLWQAARIIKAQHKGRLPNTLNELTNLPGVGPNTAGALLAYAYNRPAVFIETNIRTVYIHHFFAGQRDISDRAVLDLVAATVPDNVREWYWALMDYGTFLKQDIGNLNSRSKQYAKQSTFNGSRRQIRGQVLKLLGQKAYTHAQLGLVIDDDRLPSVLTDLVQESLISETRGRYTL
ncbi:MAG TPA: A/G-specific adenine glycosylase [Patescibacteria group bacterium]|nr:A/G-specific adenine glycosylase [Patescibacteria group bacterium]